jgi:hypothetical protein
VCNLTTVQCGATPTWVGTDTSLIWVMHLVIGICYCDCVGFLAGLTKPAHMERDCVYSVDQGGERALDSSTNLNLARTEFSEVR